MREVGTEERREEKGAREVRGAIEREVGRGPVRTSYAGRGPRVITPFSSGEKVIIFPM